MSIDPLSQIKTLDQARADLAAIEPKTRTLLLAVRQALLMVLGAIEVYLGIERSVTPRRKQE